MLSPCVHVCLVMIQMTLTFFCVTCVWTRKRRCFMLSSFSFVVKLRSPDGRCVSSPAGTLGGARCLIFDFREVKAVVQAHYGAFTFLSFP